MNDAAPLQAALVLPACYEFIPHCMPYLPEKWLLQYSSSAGTPTDHVAKKNLINLKVFTNKRRSCKTGLSGQWPGYYQSRDTTKF